MVGRRGERGEVVFMKDARVRYNAAEKLAIVGHVVRCFCLSRQDLAAELMANRFLTNPSRIESACVDTGPFMYAVHENRIEQLNIG